LLDSLLQESIMSKRLKELKQVAREKMKEEKYTEAFLHLTNALNSDPDNLEMLSDRCKCLLQSQQYNLALEDSNKLVTLAPQSSLGYARRADIFTATFNYVDALQAYQQGFQCGDSDKEACMDGINKCKREIIKDNNYDRQFPYVGCALGISMSSVLLVIDYLTYFEESYIAHPLLKVLVTVISAVFFYWGGMFYRASVRRLHHQLLEPPPDLFSQIEEEEQDHAHAD
jgi:tetratricopeptide (TPR) repeat protein